MKTPLSFQITEYDCGPTSLLNALRYLYNRQEIPVEIIKEIYKDTWDKDYHGTSREAIKILSERINKIIENKILNIHSSYLSKEEVSVEVIKNCLNNNGVVLYRTFQAVEHYSIITKISKRYAYIFDPYYVSASYFRNDKEVKNDFNHLFSFNRRVTLKRLNSEKKENFSLGPISGREVLLLNKI